MTLKSAPYWWVECALCKTKASEGGDYSAWSDKDGAISEAEGQDFREVEPDTWRCPDCGRKLPTELRELIEEADEPLPAGAVLPLAAQRPESQDDSGGPGALPATSADRPDADEGTAPFDEEKTGRAAAGFAELWKQLDQADRRTR